MVVRESLQSLQAIEGGIIDLAPLEACPTRTRLSTSVLSRQEPASKRKVRNEAHAELPGKWQHVLLRVAFQQAVFILDRGEASAARLARELVSLGKLRGGEVRAADRAGEPVVN